MVTLTFNYSQNWARLVRKAAINSKLEGMGLQLGACASRNNKKFANEFKENFFFQNFAVCRLENAAIEGVFLIGTFSHLLNKVLCMFMIYKPEPPSQTSQSTTLRTDN